MKIKIFPKDEINISIVDLDLKFNLNYEELHLNKN